MPGRKSTDAATVVRAAENGEEAVPATTTAKAPKSNNTELGVEVIVMPRRTSGRKLTVDAGSQPPKVNR